MLGAMLLSREAIAEVVETLDPDHFYKPAHGHLYDAVMGLYGAGQPVDAVTVAEELQRAGLLEEIGGPSLLLDLQASTPAISNAAHYAKIVEEHAMLRRLITVSNEIAELAYGVPDDVIKAIDEAEAKMFEVAQRRVTNTTAQIKDLLSANLDRLETLYERGDAITGISTGYLDLDEMLAGLQPNALYVIGARPAMGKALALDTALATPDGWTTMGAVDVGDLVFDEAGRPTAVTYKSPVFTRHECYQVEFDDGSVIVADAEHQWFTWDDQAWESRRQRHHLDRRGPFDQPELDCDQTHGPSGPATRTTRELAATLRVGGDGSPNHRVPVAAPIDTPEAELPFDPYVLGCWLGDEERERIPSAYLRASAKQRLALLEGLMDTVDCAVTDQSTCRLSLPDRRLLDDTRELVLSLGYKARPLCHEVADSGTDVWTLDFSALDSVLPHTSDLEAQRIVDRPESPARWRTITDVRPVDPVPTQCITVDSPSHLYLAGREMIPTHNTAFALGMTANAAMRDSKPVLFFSLEMSQLELSQRILCSEALVDSSRVRTGRIEEPEWNRISHAVGRLAEAPIYIDDNPQTSVMEIRAKARRLKSRVGELGMVVVDYVQLMTGRSNAESRQVEVSEISRGLKILARELEAPVVALAQLNRALEQRVDKRPMLSDLRESGCMPASTRIQRADNGQEVTMGELVLSQEQPLVWSVDDRQRLVPARLTKTFPSGIKPVFRLRLASGRHVEASANHPFLTIDGWRRLDAIEPGALLAIPSVVHDPIDDPASEWSDDELGLLAHLLGHGWIGTAVRYATADVVNRDYVAGVARRLFGIEAEASMDGGSWQLSLPSPHRLADGVDHPVQNWLEPHGLWAAQPWSRFVPGDVFSLPSERIAFFLHHLWASGGSITVDRSRRGAHVSTSYTSTSEELALDVQRLLQRLGIRSTVGPGEKERSGMGAYRQAYDVRIEGASAERRFLERVGCHGEQGEGTSQALAIVSDVEADSHDTSSDLYWDEVCSIEPVGEQPTFDVTIEGTHNFVADGIVAHNSLEQDADVVMFLYRDEVYDDQSPDRGVAEVIVAKHRNGPTGKTKLAFRGQYTRFDNMARSLPSAGPAPSNEPPQDF